MKSRTQVLIAFFSAMMVTLVAVSDLRRTSPGELASVHGRVPELAGRNDCSECHGGLFGTLRDACLACHEPIAAQLEEPRGLHGTLGARAEQCGLCHAEHHGAAAPIVHGQSFALAGVPKVAEFDHQLVGFVLDGAHAALDCRECHANADVPVLPEGEHRFLGLSRDCASCHEDPHEDQRAVGCASCHGQATWDGLFALGHEEVLPLVGGHADKACAECHAEGEAHALELVGGNRPPPPRDCAACHESPHSAPFLSGIARLAQQPSGAACVRCHAAEHASFHEPGLTAMTAAQHAASGFRLDPPHDAPACADCHGSEPTSFEERYPGRKNEECSACHEDVHEGQFEEGAFAGEECSACHAPLAFGPHAFDLELHARTALPLEGRHAETECAACHERPEEDAPRVFHGTASDCEACHADAHEGFFEPFLEGLAAFQHGECARCHDAAAFANAEAEFDHARFTGFAVEGAHAQAECAACHAPRAEPDEAGRRFGLVAEHFGTFEGCVTCHEDPHGGRFERPGMPAAVEGRGDCARCHGTSSFRALPRAFDHGFWTDFALAGPHAAAACAVCHEPLPGVRGGRTSAEAAGADCADCHEDPHAGQFADEFGVSDCQRCHASQEETLSVFDHERDSRFPLGEAHAALECAACHKPTRRGGLAVVLYRPLGSECTDCHGSNTEVLLRRQPRRK